MNIFCFVLSWNVHLMKIIICERENVIPSPRPSIDIWAIQCVGRKKTHKDLEINFQLSVPCGLCFRHLALIFKCLPVWAEKDKNNYPVFSI